MIPLNLIVSLGDTSALTDYHYGYSVNGYVEEKNREFSTYFGGTVVYEGQNSSFHNTPRVVSRNATTTFKPKAANFHVMHPRALSTGDLHGNEVRMVYGRKVRENYYHYLSTSCANRYLSFTE